MSIKNLVLGALLAMLLAGCNTVSLDAPRIEERSADAGAGGASSGGVGGAGAGGAGVVAQTTAPLAGGAGNVSPAEMEKVARVVYFDYDSYVIKTEFQPLVEAHARYLKGDAKRKVVIEGHTDERGGREYNLALGQRRAEAVRRALGLLGVADSQVEAISYGKEKPALSGSGEAAWSKNRRAEIFYR